jgi:hypothetical protein
MLDTNSRSSEYRCGMIAQRAIACDLHVTQQHIIVIVADDVGADDRPDPTATPTPMLARGSTIARGSITAGEPVRLRVAR